MWISLRLARSLARSLVIRDLMSPVRRVEPDKTVNDFLKYPFKYVYSTQVRVVFAVGEFASASPTAPFTLKLSEEQREVLPRTLASYKASGSNWWQCQLPVCLIIIIMYTYDLQ